jgi:FtsH-binding integral membrane protein
MPLTSVIVQTPPGTLQERSGMMASMYRKTAIAVIGIGAAFCAEYLAVTSRSEFLFVLVIALLFVALLVFLLYLTDRDAHSPPNGTNKPSNLTGCQKTWK